MGGKEFPLSIKLKANDQTAAGLNKLHSALERTMSRAKRLEREIAHLDRGMGVSPVGGRAARGAGRSGGRAGAGDGVGKWALGIGVGAAVGAGAIGKKILGEEMDFDRALTRLDISSRGAMGTMDQMRKRILAVSSATGVAREDILAGSAAFIALTGDGQQAANAMTTFARVQKATGAEMSEVAATAAALSQQLGVSANEMETAFSILARGGKEGAVEFSEMASLMASLAASFKGFGSSQGVRGVAQLGAMFQIARQDFGGSSETATGLQRFMESLSSPRTIKEMKKLHLSVFEVGRDGQKHLKPMADILDAMSKTKLLTDPTVLNKAFESSEARRAARVLLQNLDAVKQLAEATKNAKDISQDFARSSVSDAERISKSWNRIKNAVAKGAIPVLHDIAETVDPTPMAQGAQKDAALAHMARVAEKSRQTRADRMAKIFLAKGVSPDDVASGRWAGPSTGRGGWAEAADPEAAAAMRRMAREKAIAEHELVAQQNFDPSHIRVRGSGGFDPSNIAVSSSLDLLGAINKLADVMASSPMVSGRGFDPSNIPVAGPAKVEVIVRFENTPTGVRPTARAQAGQTVDVRTGYQAAIP